MHLLCLGTGLVHVIHESQKNGSDWQGPVTVGGFDSVSQIEPDLLDIDVSRSFSQQSLDSAPHWGIIGLQSIRHGTGRQRRRDLGRQCEQLGQEAQSRSSEIRLHVLEPFGLRRFSTHVRS